MKIWWIVVLLSVAAGAIGYWLTGSARQWEASALYTVAPKTTSNQLAYTDIQATNLFIDVIKSWVEDPALQNQISQKYPSTQVIEPVHLSMQTFSLRANSPQSETAQSALLLADSLLAQALDRYNRSGQMTQYTIIKGEVSARPIVPQPLANGGLAGLITLLIASLAVLLANYYRKAYAHRC